MCLMKIALLGHGTVGRGVVDIIDSGTGALEVSRILELPQFCNEARMTSNFDDIVEDDEIDAVVEAMGGLEPAHGYIVRALEAGKSVVTSNKAVVAEFFEEFVDAARANGASLFIEATTGGGIPWIAGLMKVRRVDEVSSFSGIMNGTTNYIVDQMSRSGAEFGAVLERAQGLGYAERDPSADIDGIDVKNKTIISASVAFDVACTHDLPVSGIRNLTKADLEFFASRGQSVRLLGKGVQELGSYAVAVEPTAVDARSMEAAVPDNFNLLSCEGATIGPLKFYGQGAGSLPTGNAMVQDLLDLAAGVRPIYDFSRGLAYDPTLLSGDYLIRAAGFEPSGAEPAGAGYHRVPDITAEQARSLLDEALSVDPTAFMAAIG
ncbi:MAG: homoserine dehydrogenase [Atopobiaceae bacterium]|jgi:homoserine dehydrogenase|nr:homoserine dehydrogenase [Atopobiaceae bacterium]